MRSSAIRLLQLYLLLCVVNFNYPTCVAQINSSVSIIPLPQKMTSHEGVFSLETTTPILYQGTCQHEAEFFATWLQHATGKLYTAKEAIANKLPENYILFTSTNSPVDSAVPSDPYYLPDSFKKLNPDISEEAYQIMMTPKSIILSAQYSLGIFQGIQTLRQLLPAAGEAGKLQLPQTINCYNIQDRPAFEHRGLLLDCCRHFMSVDFIKKYIDLLALYKMNVFHWHLTEDQGWRIEIKKYPELTKMGAWRTLDDGSIYGGFYTQQNIKEIVKYAEDRHITIIPEIELPGHCSSAIAAYPWLSCTGEQIDVQNEWGVFKEIYCAGDEKTFEFLENVLFEICQLFPSKYIHIGGDEVPKFRWEQCPKCQQRMRDNKLETELQLQTYFIERVAKIIQAQGKEIIGWDEILEGGISAGAAIQSWRGMEGGIKAAGEKHKVIMSPTSHCYLDYGLQSIDLKKLYSFDPIPKELSEDLHQYIIGGECNMWTEHAPQESVDGKIFPRILAMSEVLWTYPEKRNYSEFASRVQGQYDRLTAMKVQFGYESIPIDLRSVPNEKGELTLELIPQMDNLQISYHLDNSKAMKFYTAPILLKEETTIDITITNSKGVIYDQPLTRTYSPHLGIGKKIDLTYEPSAWYTGGGHDALIDGRIGSSQFRDGIWQAVQGKNMEAVVDLGILQTISQISTQWFHYGNAWIFRPRLVKFMVSDDGVNWKEIAEVKSDIYETAEGEIVVPIHAEFTTLNCRYVKMIAYNNGLNPEWHDAVGEPSWLFCDEIVIR
jgi:hexosaminidase